MEYSPAFGLALFDRFVLNAAELFAPAYRTFKRLEGAARGGDWDLTDSFANLDGIRGVLDGDFSGQLGTGKIAFGAGAILLDGGLTLLTVLPVGTGSRLAIAGPRYVMPASLGFARRQALSGLRHAGVLAASAGSSALAMAAVDVAPIDPQYKTSLRFVAGLGAGLGTGLGLARALPRVEFAVVRATQRLERATERLLAARAAGAGTRAADLAVLQKQVRRAGARVRLLRRLGGEELPAAEGAFEAARVKLAQVEETALAAGGAPSQREAAMSGQAGRAARADFKAAQGALARVYDKVDKAARRAGIPHLGGSTANPNQFHSLGLAEQQVAGRYFDGLNQNIRKLVRLDATGIQLKKALTDDELLLLSRYFRDEVLQVELVNGQVWLTRGDSYSFVRPSHITDVQQIQRMTHTHPGVADLRLSLSPGGDFAGLWVSSQGGLGLVNYQQHSLSYRIVSAQSVINPRTSTKPFVKAVAAEYSTADIVSIATAPDAGFVADTLALQAVQRETLRLQRLHLVVQP